MSIKDKAVNVIAAIGFMFVWLLFISFWYDIVYDAYFNAQFYFREPPSFTQRFWLSCIMAPVFEEIFFRKGSIDLAQRYAPDKLWLIVILTSLAFAWWHEYGYWAILVQGVLGLVSSILYIKNENSLTSSIILHMVYNFFCVWGFKFLAE